MTARPLIFVGDVHLGRRPSQLGDALRALDLRAEALGPAAALGLTVDHAIRVQARAVVFAGDVVDDAKDRFEAYGQLHAQVQRLVQAGVAVFGVAGNHDGLVLPRLADAIEGFTLIGRGQMWQCLPVDDLEPAVDLLGWSFQGEHVHDDPLLADDLATALASRRPGARVLGVVHGDLGAGTSRYAPLSEARLRAVDTDGWFLGHVHAPADLTGRRPVGYLGSLVGLDAGELGWRGPWQVVPGQPEATQQLRLGPLLWWGVTVDVTGLALRDSVALLRHITEVVREALHQAVPRWPDTLRCVAVRVQITGEASHPLIVEELVSTQATPNALLGLSVPAVLESLQDHTRPAIDLQQLALERTPAGAVARQLLDLTQRQVLPSWFEAEALSAYTPSAWDLPAEDHAPLDALSLLERALWAALRALERTRAEPVVRQEVQP